MSIRTPVLKNNKGYSTVGLVYPRTAMKLRKGTDTRRIPNVYSLYSISSTLNKWSEEGANIDKIKSVSCLLLQYVNVHMVPSYEEIDNMLTICRVLLKYKMTEEFSDFIYSCPEKFLLTYTNNSEHSCHMFSNVKALGLKNVCAYLAKYVHSSKLGTWNERINVHLGNSSFEEMYM